MATYAKTNTPRVIVTDRTTGERWLVVTGASAPKASERRAMLRRAATELGLLVGPDEDLARCGGCRAIGSLAAGGTVEAEDGTRYAIASLQADRVVNDSERYIVTVAEDGEDGVAGYGNATVVPACPACNGSRHRWDYIANLEECAEERLRNAIKLT
jgi:hypothetical protein